MLQSFKAGGVLLGGYDNGINYIVDEEQREIVFCLPFDPLCNAEQRTYLEKDNYGIQFSHTLADQLGGQREAGFSTVDIYEDTNEEGRLHNMNIPTFFAVKAIK